MARTYHVRSPKLAAANQMDADQSVAGMEALVVPVAPVAAPSVHTLLYTTRRGDTLVSIADRFGVSLDQLRRWNKIPSGIKVEPGRQLHVAEAAAALQRRGVAVRLQARRLRILTRSNAWKRHCRHAAVALRRNKPSQQHKAPHAISRRPRPQKPTQRSKNSRGA